MVFNNIPNIKTNMSVRDSKLKKLSDILPTLRYYWKMELVKESSNWQKYDHFSGPDILI